MNLEKFKEKKEIHNKAFVFGDMNTVLSLNALYKDNIVIIQVKIKLCDNESFPFPSFLSQRGVMIHVKIQLNCQ